MSHIVDAIAEADLRDVCKVLHNQVEDLNLQLESTRQELRRARKDYSQTVVSQLRLAEEAAAEWQSRFKECQEELKGKDEQIGVLLRSLEKLQDKDPRSASSVSLLSGLPSKVDLSNLRPARYDGSVPAEQFVRQFTLYADLAALSREHRLAEFQLTIAQPKAFNLFSEILAKGPGKSFEELTALWSVSTSVPNINRIEAAEGLRRLRQKIGEDFVSLANRALELAKAAHPSMLQPVLEEVASDAFHAAILDEAMVSQLRVLTVNRRLMSLAPLELLDLAEAANQLSAASGTKIADQVSKLQQDLAALKASKESQYVPPNQRHQQFAPQGHQHPPRQQNQINQAIQNADSKNGQPPAMGHGRV